MSNSSEESASKPQPAISKGPQWPPKITSRDLGGKSGNQGNTVYLFDRMRVRDLAIAIALKPFQVVAELMEMKQFKQPDEEIDFDTASLIARKHGYRPEKSPPGILVL